MPRASRWAAGVAAAALALSGCGSDSPAPEHTDGAHVETVDDSAASSPARREPVPAAAREFVWADRNTVLVDAGTLTTVRGVDPAQALRIIAPDALTPVLTVAQARRFVDLRDRASASSDASWYQVVAATSRGGSTLVLEDAGDVANDNRVVRALSRRGATTVLSSNADGDTIFTYARRGRIVRSFDPLLDITYVGRRLPQEHDLHLGTDATSDHTLALSLALSERLTGVTTRRTDLSHDLVGYTRAVVVKL